MSSGRPLQSAFTAPERRLIDRLTTPSAVQAYLNRLPYNTEPPPDPATLRSFRGVASRGTANCIEAALSAAVILEQHGYPPLVVSLASVDELDHVLFVYRRRGRWGAIARSRDPGLHGRRSVFRTVRHLALSYCDPYVDATGCVTGYGLLDLRTLGSYDWRLSAGNVWKVERALFEVPHRPIRMSRARVARLRRRYLTFRASHPGLKPLDYDRRSWSELPIEYRRQLAAPSRGRSRDAVC